MEESKKPWQSKTIWVNLLMAAAAFYPPAQEFLSAHPEMVMGVFSIVNLILRFKTDSAVSLKD